MDLDFITFGKYLAVRDFVYLPKENIANSLINTYIDNQSMIAQFVSLMWCPNFRYHDYIFNICSEIGSTDELRGLFGVSQTYSGKDILLGYNEARAFLLEEAKQMFGELCVEELVAKLQDLIKKESPMFYDGTIIPDIVKAGRKFY